MCVCVGGGGVVNSKNRINLRNPRTALHSMNLCFQNSFDESHTKNQFNR